MCEPKGGPEDWPKPSRSTLASFQAPRDLRRPGPATLTGAHRHDVPEPIALVERVPSTGAHGKFRPKALLADCACDSQRHRKAAGARNHATDRQTQHDSWLGLDKGRQVIERTLSWPHQQRRLERRYDRRADIHEALLRPGLQPLTPIIPLGALSPVASPAIGCASA